MIDGQFLGQSFLILLFRMDNGMEIRFTVFFDDPFWVGVCEKQDEDAYTTARVVFGSEPGEAELYQFVIQHYNEFRFTQPVASGGPLEKQMNFKRAQRQARQNMQARGIGSKAQQAMKTALSEAKQERSASTRDEHQQAAERRYQEQQAKKKEKHRGH
jgi:hypothetical protein